MDNDIKQKLEEQSQKIDAIYTSVEKARKYFLFLIWATIIGLLLPLLGILIEAPKVMNSYTETLNGN